MRQSAAGAIAVILLAGGACGAHSTPGRAAGDQIFRQCNACHALEPGRNSPAGPTLHGIVGGPIAAQPGFNYSPALRRLAVAEVRWTRDLLERFLADPQAVAPGTEMGFIGLDGSDRRRVLIDWLAQQPASGN